MRATRAFFLAVPNRAGQRFCIYHPPHAKPCGRVLYIHPFAEEMNKARRMSALGARRLAQAGFSVLQIDLKGCGDSSDDFGDAVWQDWLDDVLIAEQWLREQEGALPATPLWLWGLRAGCLLAAQAASRIDAPANLLFWQPASAGKMQLQQFLRLRMAAELQGGQGKTAMQRLRDQIGRGETIEVAGYRIAAGLAQGLESATLAPPLQSSGRVEWLEVNAQADAGLSPVSSQTLNAWLAAGVRCRSCVVQGPQFWQTTEIEEAPALIDATLAALLNDVAGA